MGVAGDVGIDGDQWAQCVQQRGWLWNGAVQGAGWTLILAHGAGAPMDSQWMAEMAERLAVRGVNVLRFEFPYMAQRRRGLEAFYGSDFWWAHRDAVNATLVDSDDVFLLRPAWPGGGLVSR